MISFLRYFQNLFDIFWPIDNIEKSYCSLHHHPSVVKVVNKPVQKRPKISHFSVKLMEKLYFCLWFQAIFWQTATSFLFSLMVVLIVLQILLKVVLFYGKCKWVELRNASAFWETTESFELICSLAINFHGSHIYCFFRKK